MLWIVQLDPIYFKDTYQNWKQPNPNNHISKANIDTIFTTTTQSNEDAEFDFSVAAVVANIFR